MMKRIFELKSNKDLKLMEKLLESFDSLCSVEGIGSYVARIGDNYIGNILRVQKPHLVIEPDNYSDLHTVSIDYNQKNYYSFSSPFFVGLAMEYKFCLAFFDSFKLYYSIAGMGPMEKKLVEHDFEKLTSLSNFFKIIDQNIEIKGSGGLEVSLKKNYHGRYVQLNGDYISINPTAGSRVDLVMPRRWIDLPFSSYSSPNQVILRIGSVPCIITYNP